MEAAVSGTIQFEIRQKSTLPLWHKDVHGRKLLTIPAVTWTGIGFNQIMGFENE